MVVPHPREKPRVAGAINTTLPASRWRGTTVDRS